MELSASIKASLSGRYAAALFELASEAGKVTAVETDLEKIADAARESAEEAGHSGPVSRQHAARYYYSKALSSGEDVPCEVLVYALEVDKVAEKWKEKRQRKRKWVTPSEAARMLNEPDLCKLVSAFGADPRRFAA